MKNFFAKLMGLERRSNTERQQANVEAQRRRNEEQSDLAKERQEIQKEHMQENSREVDLTPDVERLSGKSEEAA